MDGRQVQAGLRATAARGRSTLRCPPLQAPKERSGPAPVIIFPHGGPHTAIAINYYMPFALLTSLGYAVVAVNYRWGQAVNVASPPAPVAHTTP